MPFKGDSRLGGPHDNEARLNGTSEGPSVPSSGTVLQSGLTSPVIVYFSWHPSGEAIPLQTGTDTYNVVADGLGGTYNVVTYQDWVPLGTYIGPQFGETPLSTTHEGIDYNNGKSVVSRFVSDGQGEFTIGQGVEEIGSYYDSGQQVNGSPQYSILEHTTEHPSSLMQVANGMYSYDSLIWDGEGGIALSTGAPYTGGQFYPDGTLESDAEDSSVEVPYDSMTYFFDGNDNRWEWDGNGGIVFRYSGLYGYGTYITTYGDNNYYWDGMGGYYSEYAGSGGGGEDMSGGGGEDTSGGGGEDTSGGGGEDTSGGGGEDTSGGGEDTSGGYGSEGSEYP